MLNDVEESDNSLVYSFVSGERGLIQWMIQMMCLGKRSQISCDCIAIQRVHVLYVGDSMQGEGGVQHHEG